MVQKGSPAVIADRFTAAGSTLYILLHKDTITRTPVLQYYNIGVVQPLSLCTVHEAGLLFLIFWMVLAEASGDASR